MNLISRTLVTIGCVLPIILVCLTCALTVYNSSITVEPLKQLMNQSLDLSAYSSMQVDTTAPNIDLSKRTVEVSEQTFVNLLRSTLPQSRAAALKLSAGTMSLLMDVSANGQPLWLRVEFSVDNGEIRLVGGGVGTVDLPKDLVQSVGNQLTKSLADINLNDPDYLLAKILNIEPSRVESVEVVENYITFQLDAE